MLGIGPHSSSRHISVHLGSAVTATTPSSRECVSWSLSVAMKLVAGVEGERSMAMMSVSVYTCRL